MSLNTGRREGIWSEQQMGISWCSGVQRVQLVSKRPLAVVRVEVWLPPGPAHASHP